MDSELRALAGLILLAMMTNKDEPIRWGDGWVWPVPDLDSMVGGRAHAVISQEFRGRRDPHPHYGVDIMYRSQFPPPTFTAPEGTPILAARAGRLWSVQKTSRGWSVVLDHGPPFATFYQHLESVAPELAVGPRGVDGRPGMSVAAGQRLGVMGSDPTDGGHVRHLHFAVWYHGAGDSASVDPASAMAAWERKVAPWTTA